MTGVGRRIWLVRHGYRQDYSSPRWPQRASYPFDPPLSEQGLIQAQDLIKAFASIRPNHVFVSPYLRTLQTVKPLATAYQCLVKVEAGLGEIHPENISPLSLSPSQRKHFIPQIDGYYQSCTSLNGLETRSLAKQRAAQTLEKLLCDHPGNLLLISHESPIRGMVKHLVPTTKAIRCSFCGVTELHDHSGEWTLMRNGDVRHLSTPTTKKRFLYDYVRRQMVSRFNRKSSES